MLKEYLLEQSFLRGCVGFGGLGEASDDLPRPNWEDRVILLWLIHGLFMWRGSIQCIG